MFEDKTLQCKDCGADFIWTSGEQEFYQEKGFDNQPLRCAHCRAEHKAQIRANRTYHEGTCAGCGGTARVPFQPSQDKPIYCSDCYENMNPKD